VGGRYAKGVLLRKVTQAFVVDESFATFVTRGLVPLRYLIFQDHHLLEEFRFGEWLKVGWRYLNVCLPFAEGLLVLSFEELLLLWGLSLAQASLLKLQSLDQAIEWTDFIRREFIVEICVDE